MTRPQAQERINSRNRAGEKVSMENLDLIDADYIFFGVLGNAEQAHKELDAARRKPGFQRPARSKPGTCTPSTARRGRWDRPLGVEAILHDIDTAFRQPDSPIGTRVHPTDKPVPAERRGAAHHTQARLADRPQSCGAADPRHAELLRRRLRRGFRTAGNSGADDRGAARGRRCGWRACHPDRPAATTTPIAARPAHTTVGSRHPDRRGSRSHRAVARPPE